jgi:hypothetical protein
MNTMVPLSELVFREDLYPRQSVNDFRVKELLEAVNGGQVLPAIIAGILPNESQKIIVDGVHRCQVASRLGAVTINTEIKQYTNEIEIFKDASLLNTAHGLNLTQHDRLKVIEIGERLGLKELDLSTILRTSVAHVRSLMPRFATAPNSTGTMERVPLKASTRHLSGATITAEQAKAIRGNAPGMSYLVLIRQLKSALINDLLPPETDHPALWKDLRELRNLIS